MDSIALSIDSYTLDTAAGKRRVEAILPDGSLIYKQPCVTNVSPGMRSVADTRSKAPGDDLSEQVGRLWHEIPDGFLDLYDAQLAQLPQDEPVVPPTEDEVEEELEREPGEALSLDEMQDMRVKVRDELK
jgi:hypothetical protein